MVKVALEPVIISGTLYMRPKYTLDEQSTMHTLSHIHTYWQFRVANPPTCSVFREPPMKSLGTQGKHMKLHELAVSV